MNLEFGATPIRSNSQKQKSAVNPYEQILFPPPVLEQEINNLNINLAPNSIKSPPKNTRSTSVGDFMTNVLNIPQFDSNGINNMSRANSGTFPIEDQIKSFSSIPTLVNRVFISSERNKTPDPIPEPSNPPENVIIQAATIYPELPPGPDPSLLIPTPPEHYLLPPKLWAKQAKEKISSSDYEEPIPPPPIMTKRKRGRPRKNPLPDPNEYNPRHATTYKTRRSYEEPPTPSPPPSPPSPSQNEGINSKKVSFIDDDNDDLEVENEEDDEIKTRKLSDASDETTLPELPDDRPEKAPLVVFPETNIDEIVGAKGESQFYIKMKNESYNHLRWESKEELFKHPNGEKIYKGFKNLGIPTKPPYFNPLFTQPERLIDKLDNKVLIKWYGLKYKYSTWETEFSNNQLNSAFDSIKNPVKPREPDSFSTIDIHEQFSLDEYQEGVVNNLYQKFFERKDSLLLGNIGSILRLEFAALISVINEKHSITMPYLIIVDQVVYELAIEELSVYTPFQILGIPGDDLEEFEFIKNHCYVFQDKKPKFQVLVVSADIYDRFIEEYPPLNWVIAAVDGSEIVSHKISISNLKARMRLNIRRRDDKHEEIDSQDDTTNLHEEITVVCPMISSQKELYHSILSENLDLFISKPENADPSRLFEVTTKLSAISNIPALLKSQELVLKDNKAMAALTRKGFVDSGKMRVLTELIYYSHRNNKRLMILCRDALIIDLLELYFNANGIQNIRITSLCQKKRIKLEEISQDAKANKKIVVIAVYSAKTVNWVALENDIIVVFDGTSNPMYYFAHTQRKPRRRECKIIRLLTGGTHELYLGACADHYEEVDHYDIFRAAALDFMIPKREEVTVSKKYPKCPHFDANFSYGDVKFQYLFDDEAIVHDKKREYIKSDSEEEEEEEDDDRLEPSPSPPQVAEIVESSKIVKKDVESKEEEIVKQRRLRRLVKKWRIMPGEVIKQPQNGKIVIRKHKHRRNKMTEAIIPKYLQFPEKIVFEKSDFTHDWTLDELDSVFLTISRYSWGLWDKMSLCLNGEKSPAAIRECAHYIVRYILSKYQYDKYHLLEAVIMNFKPTLESRCFSNLSTFVTSQTENNLKHRLSRIEDLLCASLIVSNFDSPINCDEAPPFTWWTSEDDKALIYNTWKYGYIFYSLDFNVFTRKEKINSAVLSQRFEQLIHEYSRNINQDRIGSMYRSFGNDLDDSVEEIDETILNHLRNFGNDDIAQIAKESEKSVEYVSKVVSVLLKQKYFYTISDLYENIRRELSYRNYYYCEDYQFLEAIAFHGLDHSNQSHLISLYISPPIMFKDIKFKVESILDSKLEHAIDGSEAMKTSSITDYEISYPIVITNKLSVLRLGTIVNDRPGFHNQDYIYPVGYQASIQYHSPISPGIEETYIMEIIDTHGEYPLFKIYLKKDQSIFFEGSSPEEVWQKAAEKVMKVREKPIFEAKKTPGHELFGLSLPLTLMFIQSLPGADQCKGYRPRAFKTKTYTLLKKGLIRNK